MTPATTALTPWEPILLSRHFVAARARHRPEPGAVGRAGSGSGAGVFATGTMRWVEALKAGTPDGGRDHAMDARTRAFVTRTTENALRAFAEGPATHHRPAARPNVGEVYRERT